MMRNQRGGTTSGGLLGLVFLVLLTLKLAGVGVVAAWSWWLVTAPLWGGVALALVFVVLWVIIWLLDVWAAQRARQRRERRP